ncbi:MAG: hypothetical protein ACRDSP_19860 [Pseudonocardiaceae bacterium]
MCTLGASVPQIAAEMTRRFALRPRVAWRHALGWPQWKLAQRYNTAHPGAKLSDNRISEYENWPHGGSPPSLRYLARLAATSCHGTAGVCAGAPPPGGSAGVRGAGTGVHGGPQHPAQHVAHELVAGLLH